MPYIAPSERASSHSGVSMLANPLTSEDEVCPVADELLGELCNANKLGLPVLVSTVPSEVRAMLALFCYRRSHLHALGLVIAASCDEYDLVKWGGRLGAAIFVKSREAPQPKPAESNYAARRKITLATGPLLKMLPVDDEPDDEAGAPIQTVA
jgi:hypothetical protein